MIGTTKGTGFSYRPKIEHEKRIADLVEATKHKKAHFLDFALEITLPELEKKHAEDLAELREKRKQLAMNESGKLAKPAKTNFLKHGISYLKAGKSRTSSADNAAARDARGRSSRKG